MKKNVILTAFILACCFVFAACGKGDANDIIGVWKTENVGYYTITTFNEDGSFGSVYTVSDPQAVEAYGITQEMLDTMKNESYYKFVPAKSLSDEEKDEAAGRFAIKIFATREDMESDTNGSMSYYTVDGDTLVLDGCVFARN